jgi:thioester reductase-like protein
MNHNRKSTTEPWYQDAMLDESISISGLTTGFVKNPKHVLVTGATGFIGTYLVSEILKQTEAKVYALIRAENQMKAFARIREKMEKSLLWRDGYSERILPCVGEFGKERLGLPDDQWDRLAEQVDIIYHNGAEVNFLLPYGKLAPNNVQPTVELIKLAVAKKVKRINYNSVANVFDISNLKSKEVVYEEQPTETINSALGYVKSKWVSDKLLQEVSKRGVPVTIYRLALVGGDMVTGYVNLRNLFWIITRACLQAKIAPNIDEPIYLVPVDFLAKALVYISLKPQAAGRFYSAMNWERVTRNDLFRELRSLGHDLKIMAGEEWRQAMLQYLKSGVDRSLLPLAQLIRTGLPFKSPIFDTRNFQNILAGSGIECPAFAEMIKVYNGYLTGATPQTTPGSPQ